MTGEPVAQTTVVVPVWDEYAGERLTEALASLQTQEVAAALVLVDNASRAELPDLPGVTVIRSPRRLTLGEARNLGLSAVTTPYVVVWDADDLMLPGTLAFLEKAISSQPQLAAFAMAIVEDPSGARHRWPRRWVAVIARCGSLFAVLDSVWSVYPTTGATIMRTELVRAGGGYASADSGEDWCLGVSLAFRGRIGWSERPGRLYQLHEQSVWMRHMTVRHQLGHAEAVRERIRSDSEIPNWARRLLPLTQLTQYAAIAAHALIASARSLRLTLRRGRRYAAARPSSDDPHGQDPPGRK